MSLVSVGYSINHRQLLETYHKTSNSSHPCYVEPWLGHPFEHRFEVEGRCEQYDGNLQFPKKDTPDVTDLAMCKDLIDYEYYIDNDSTQLDYEQYMRWEFFNVSTPALVIPLLNSKCQKSFKRVFCANHFRRCVTDSDGKAQPLPVCPSMGKDYLLVESAEGSVCESAFLPIVGERAIVPTVLATGRSIAYDINAVPDSYIFSTEEAEDNGQCTFIDYEGWDVQDTLGTYDGELCEGIVDTYYVPPTIHVFQPPGLHIDYLDGRAWNISLEGVLDPVSPLIMPTPCQSEWKKFACRTVYMEVEPYPVFGRSIAAQQSDGSWEPYDLVPEGWVLANLPFPRFLRREQCEIMTSTCADFIEYANEQLEEDGDDPLDICNTKIEGVSAAFDGKPQFPEEVLPRLVALGGPTNLRCNAVVISIVGQTVELEIVVSTETKMLDHEPYSSFLQHLACPFPLKVPPDHKLDQGVLFTGCAIPCPKPYWPESYHITIKWYLIVVAWICFLAISYSMITFLYFKRLRKQRQTIIFSGCTWMLCWSQVMMSFWSGNFHHLCTEDNINTIEQSDGFTACLSQSMTMMYFATACTYWWFLVSMELFMKVHNKLRLKLRFKTQFIIAQGLPILWCSYFYFLKAMGNQSLHLCWVNKLGLFGPHETEDNPEGFVNNIDKPWYFATVINLVAGLTMMILTMAKIARVDAKAANKSTTKSSSGSKKEKKEKLGARQKKTINVYMKKWRLYKTSVYFIVLYVGLFIVICAYRFIEASDGNQNAIIESAGEWGLCLFENFPYPGYDPIQEGDCPDGPEKKPDVLFMAILMTFVICLGFGMYVIYGSKKEYVKMWKNELAAKGMIGAQSSLRNASNVNGTICSSRAGDDGPRKKKKRGFFQNSVMASSGVASSNVSSGISSGVSSSTASSTHQDEKENDTDYIPPRHVLNALRKKEKAITKLDSKCGVYQQTEAVEEVRSDLTSFTIHIGALGEWATKVPTFLEAREGAIDDLRDTLYLMTKASQFPELQGWICAKYTYDPSKGAVFMKPVIEAQDRTQALLGIKYHWNSGDFLWLKHKSATKVDCHKMVAEDINDVAHSFDPTPLLKECEKISLQDVHKQFQAVCNVDVSMPYWS